MSLTTPFSVQKLQTALHAKAKESPNFRFHALYDKVYRKEVLAFAYERCKANGGAAGVDNQTFENIEAYGNERWLDELAQELVKLSKRSGYHTGSGGRAFEQTLEIVPQVGIINPRSGAFFRADLEWLVRNAAGQDPAHFLADVIDFISTDRASA